MESTSHCKNSVRATKAFMASHCTSRDARSGADCVPTTGPNHRIIQQCLFLDSLGPPSATHGLNTSHVPPVNYSYVLGVREQDLRRTPINSPGAEMQQIPHQINNRAAPQARNHTSSLKTQTKASMTTEYRERFRPPSYFRTVVSSAAEKSPYHPLKGTRDEITSLRPIYVTHQCNQKSPQRPESGPSKDSRKCKRAQLSTANRSAGYTPPKTDYTSVYQNDFKPWKASKCQPYILKDNLTLKHGLGKQENGPTGNTTSYKSDYVYHPAQPRPVQLKRSNESSNDLPLEPRLSFKPKQAWSIYQDILDKASDFHEKFNSCSLETKFQDNTKDFTSPVDHSIHCQASVQNLSISGEKLQSFTPVKTAVGKPKFTTAKQAQRL